MASGAESPATTFGVIENVHLVPVDRRDGDDRQLSDPIASGEGDILRAVVDQENRDFPSVAGVDQTGTVDDAHSCSTGVTGASQHQPGKSLRYRHREPGGNRDPLTRRQGDVDSGVKIDGGVADMGLYGNWQFPIEEYEVNLHGVQGHRAVNLTISERLDDCDNQVGP